MTRVLVCALQPFLVRACQMRHHQRHLWVAIFTSNVVGWTDTLSMNTKETEQQNGQEKCFHAAYSDIKGTPSTLVPHSCIPTGALVYFRETQRKHTHIIVVSELRGRVGFPDLFFIRLHQSSRGRSR